MKKPPKSFVVSWQKRITKDKYLLQELDLLSSTDVVKGNAMWQQLPEPPALDTSLIPMCQYERIHSCLPLVEAAPIPPAPEQLEPPKSIQVSLGAVSEKPPLRRCLPRPAGTPWADLTESDEDSDTQEPCGGHSAHDDSASCVSGAGAKGTGKGYLMDLAKKLATLYFVKTFIVSDQEAFVLQLNPERKRNSG